MGLDLNDDYSKAKTKISAYQTVVENKKNDVQQKKQKAKTSLDNNWTNPSPNNLVYPYQLLQCTGTSFSEEFKFEPV
jgi:hypothetical protein